MHGGVQIVIERLTFTCGAPMSPAGPERKGCRMDFSLLTDQELQEEIDGMEKGLPFENRPFEDGDARLRHKIAAVKAEMEKRGVSGTQMPEAVALAQ